MKGAGSETVLVASVSLIQVRERREIITTIIRMTSAVLYTIYLSSTLCLSHLSHHCSFHDAFRSVLLCHSDRPCAPLRGVVVILAAFAELLPV